MDCVTLDCKWKLEIFFVLYHGKCKEIGKIGEILSGGPRPQKTVGKLTNNRLSEFRNFPRENVEIFWWSAKRDKICQGVRESEKVENRCSSGSRTSQTGGKFLPKFLNDLV